MIYPWHTSNWQQLVEHWHNQPNAWLFTGKAGTGKSVFARHVAQALLCEHPLADHAPCGECSSCHLFLQGTHPDFHLIEPEEVDESNAKKLRQIKIDAVRNLMEGIHLTTVRGGRRIILINPAENMNVQAANALLKILEEPPEKVVFLLVGNSRDKLLPTIKSRCRQMVLTPPSHETALAYLQQQQLPNAADLLAFHSGAPLFSHTPSEDELREELIQLLAKPRLLSLLDYAQAFDKKKQPLATLLDWFQKWLIDVALAQQHLPPLYYPQYQNDIQHTATRTQASALFSLFNTLNHLSPYGQHTLSVKMQAESLFIDYLNFWQNKNTAL